MKTTCRCALRDYLTNRLIESRKNNGLTQAKFSEILMIDTRSYAALEHGESLCCTLTFIIYICFICEDVNKLVDDLRNILIKTQNTTKETLQK